LESYHKVVTSGDDRIRANQKPNRGWSLSLVWISIERRINIHRANWTVAVIERPPPPLKVGRQKMVIVHHRPLEPQQIQTKTETKRRNRKQSRRR